MADDLNLKQKPEVVYQAGATTNVDTHPVKVSQIKNLGFYSKRELEYLESVFENLRGLYEKTQANRILQLYRNQKLNIRFQLKSESLSVRDETLIAYDGLPSDNDVRGQQKTLLFFVDFVSFLIGIASTLQENFPTTYLSEYSNTHDPTKKLLEWGPTGSDEYVSQEQLQYQVEEIESLIEAIELAFVAWENSSPEVITAQEESVKKAEASELHSAVVPKLDDDHDEDVMDSDPTEGAGDDTTDTDTASNRDVTAKIAQQKQFLYGFAKVNLIDQFFRSAGLDATNLPPEFQAHYFELLEILRTEINSLQLTDEEIESLISGGAGETVLRARLYNRLLARLFGRGENGFFVVYQELMREQVDYLLAQNQSATADALTTELTTYLSNFVENEELQEIQQQVHSWIQKLQQQTQQVRIPEDSEPTLSENDVPTPPIQPSFEQLTRITTNQGVTLTVAEQKILPKQAGHVIWGAMAQVFPEEALRNNTIPPQLFGQINEVAIEYLASLSPTELQKITKSPSSLIRHIKNLSIRIQTNAELTSSLDAFLQTTGKPNFDRLERIEVETTWAIENAKYELFSASTIGIGVITQTPKLEKEFLEAEQKLEAKVYAYVLTLSNDELLQLYLNQNRREQLFEQIIRALNSDPAFRKELGEFYQELIKYYKENGLTTEQALFEKNLKHSVQFEVLYDEGSVRFILDDIKKTDPEGVFAKQLAFELKDDSPITLKRTSDILDAMIITHGQAGTEDMVSKLDTKLLGMMFALPSDQITDTNHLTIREILIEYTRVRALNINPGEGAIQTGFLPIPEIPKTALELEVHRVAISNMAHSVEHNGSEETAAVTGGKIRHRIEAAKLVAGHAWGPLETEQRAALYIFFDIPIPPAIRERIVSKSTDPVADKNSLAVPLEFVGFTGDVDKITEAAWRGKFRVLDFGETQQRPTIQKSEVYQDIVNLKRLENELILAQYTVLPEDQQIAVALQLQQTPEDLQLVLAQSVGSMDDRVVLSAPQTEEFAALATAAGAPAASGGDFSPQTRAAGLNSMASGAIKDLVTKKLGSKLLEYGAAAVAGPAGWALQLKNIARVGQKLINNKEFRQIVIAGGSGVGLAAAATFLYAFGNIPGALTMIASFIVGGPIGLLYGLPLALGVAKLFPGLNWLPVRTPPNPFGFEGSEQSAAGYKSLSEMREANSASAAAKNGGTTSVNEGQTATARSSTTQTPSQAQAASQAESAGAHNPQSGVTQAFSTPATATATTSSSLGFLSAGGIGLLAPVLAVAPVFLITLLTITVIAGAFLVNLPTKPFRKIGFTSTGEQASAKYVTVTKTPDKGNNPNEIANNTATTINYTVTIAPKPGYTIKITEATDTFSSFGEQTSSDPISSTFAVSQIPTEVLTTQAPPITYTAAISNKFKDAYITNTFSIQFTVMDTTGNIVENNQIFNAAANVLIGEPKIGCWPVTGVLTTYPFMKSVPTHATTDAFDIGAPLGTPIYAPFPGSINDRDFDRRGYGNLITLEFVIPGDSTGQKRVVFFAHLSGVAAKFKGKNAEPVAAGEVIGYVGSTGNSTGPHLHYELKNNRNNPGDPGLGIRNIVPGGLTATVGTPTRSCK